MLKAIFITTLLLLSKLGNAQTFIQKLEASYIQLQKDSLLQKANISFCMINTKNGQVIFQQNQDLPLPPASTIKTFTTASVLHYLGENFRYETRIAFKGSIQKDSAYGELIIYASGDPSLGSERFEETKPLKLMVQIQKALLQKGIKNMVGNIRFVNTIFQDTCCSPFWLEEDYGNYYGAGIFPLNWKENKFDLTIKPTDTMFKVVSNTGGLNNQQDFNIELQPKIGAGSEDCFAYITPQAASKYAIRGFLSPRGGEQTISLASINPMEDFKRDLISYLNTIGSFTYRNIKITGKEIPLLSIHSPKLSQLVNACNQKSLNLYAESFCKTIAYKKSGKGTWEKGIDYMNLFAKKLQIKNPNIDLKDASGLSPQNRITTATMAQLLYAYTKQPWHKLFTASLPIINNMTMKSGYIGGTRSYTGYSELKDKTPVCFAFIVNNYSGSPKAVKEKMFQFLNSIKD